MMESTFRLVVALKPIPKNFPKPTTPNLKTPASLHT